MTVQLPEKATDYEKMKKVTAARLKIKRCEMYDTASWVDK